MSSDMPGAVALNPSTGRREVEVDTCDTRFPGPLSEPRPPVGRLLFPLLGEQLPTPKKSVYRLFPCVPSPILAIQHTCMADILWRY